MTGEKQPMIRHFFSTASAWLDRAVSGLVVALLTVMVAVTTAGVVSRYGFNSALSWSEELGRYLLVWISFLGAGLATYRGSHIGISILFDRLPKKARQWLVVFTDGVIVLFMGAVLAGGIKTLPMIHVRTAPTLSVPMSLPYLIMPVATGIIIFHILARLVSGERREP